MGDPQQGLTTKLLTMTEESGSSVGGVKLPQFDGEGNIYPIWETRFAAYARLKRFEKTLKNTMDLPSNQNDYKAVLAKSTPTDDEKIKKKNVRVNECSGTTNDGISNLISICTCKAE